MRRRTRSIGAAYLRFGARPSRQIFLATAVAVILVGPGGEAIASHVSCGDSITADTTLDSDLIDCPNNGIVIGADDVTLDLNGHTIDGDNALVDPCPENEFCDVGVLNDGHNGVRITGGTVREFGFGAGLFGARKNGVGDLSTFENTFAGILLVDSARSRVRGNSAARNKGPDSGVGIVLFESHNNRIAHNTLSGNHELALHLLRSDHNHIGNNRVRGRHREGGILVEGVGNEIARNRLVRQGILISIFTDGGRAVGTLVARNHVRNATKGGITVDSKPRGTVIKRNHVFGSGASGIGVFSSRTTLTGNEARHNHRLGIKAVEGVIDGGGNRASGNGDPRQCVNVTCQ
jgi:parallel beta-helix repeat protein